MSIYWNGSKFPVTEEGVPYALNELGFLYTCCFADYECLLNMLNERRSVLGLSDITGCITQSEFIAYMEAIYSSFVDHVNGPLTADKTGFLMFTKETWYAAAGIDGTWKEGDLRKALETLVSTPIPTESILPDTTYLKTANVVLTNEYCDDALTSYYAVWASATWGVTAVSVDVYNARAWVYAIGEKEEKGDYTIAASRKRGTLKQSSVKPVSCAVEFFMRFSATSLWDFNDMDGSGATEGEYMSVCEIASSTDTDVISDLIDYSGGVDDPISLTGFECPVGDGWNTGWIWRKDIQTGHPMALLKWDFTEC